MLGNTFVSDGEWHQLVWTRKFKRITLTLDETSTAQADLPGAESEFNVAQGPVVYVDIGGFPAGVSQIKGKCYKTVGSRNKSQFNAPFNNMQTLKFKTQPTVTLLSAVNHCSGPLRKQKRLAQRGQSRTQSPQAFWSAGNAGKTLGTSNFITAGFLR